MACQFVSVLQGEELQAALLRSVAMGWGVEGCRCGTVTCRGQDQGRLRRERRGSCKHVSQLLRRSQEAG